MLSTVAYMRTGHLRMSIGFHTAWNDTASRDLPGPCIRQRHLQGSGDGHHFEVTIFTRDTDGIGSSFFAPSSSLQPV